MVILLQTSNNITVVATSSLSFIDIIGLFNRNKNKKQKTNIY
jgi:hypothetical protein